MVNKREKTAYKAAQMYYLQDLTMNTIARRLKLSRSSVSRLLSYAREIGIVSIKLNNPDSTTDTLSQEFKTNWGVNTTIVQVPVGTSPDKRLEYTLRVCASDLEENLKPTDIIGIAWGNTTTELVKYLPKRDLKEVTVVQLNGAESISSSGVPHSAYLLNEVSRILNARVIHFPTPAFFDQAETKTAMWKETSIKKVLEMQKRCTKAIFGIGCLDSSIPSQVYAAGYFSNPELNAMKKDGIVGDICTVLLRKDGSWQGIEINKRATGPSPTRLRQIPQRIAAVADHSKVKAIIAALNAKVVTDLYIDDITARAVLQNFNS